MTVNDIHIEKLDDFIKKGCEKITRGDCKKCHLLMANLLVDTCVDCIAKEVNY